MPDQELLKQKFLKDRLYDTYRAVLTDKQTEIMDGYYYDDLSVTEIADNRGVSRQAVHDTIKKAEQTISDLEHRLGFFEYLRRHEALVERLTLLSVSAEKEEGKKEGCLRQVLREVAEELKAMVDSVG